MSARALSLLGRALTLAWVAILALLLSLLIGTNLAPALGGSIYVIHGGSMEPSLPLGALIVDRRVDPATIAVGEVITFQESNGVVVTHRVSRVVGAGDTLRFEMRGDANATPDPVLIEASAVLGRISFQVPLLGYLVAMLSTPSGLLSVITLVGALLAASWLIDELRPDPAPVPRRRRSGSDELRPA